MVTLARIALVMRVTGVAAPAGYAAGARSDVPVRLRARTFRLANGAHLLSVAPDAGPEAPTLAGAIDRVPANAEVVVNLEGIDSAEAWAVQAELRASRRVRDSARRIIVVCDSPAIGAVLRRMSVDQLVLIEASFEDALRFIVGSRWLTTLAEVGT